MVRRAFLSVAELIVLRFSFGIIFEINYVILNFLLLVNNQQNNNILVRSNTTWISRTAFCLLFCYAEYS